MNPMGKDIYMTDMAHSFEKTPCGVMEAAYPKVKNIQATVEVIYGHAWKPESRTTQPVNATGEVSIPLGNITRR